MSKSVELADAVVDLINAKTNYIFGVVAKRRRVPFDAIDKLLRTPQVSVFQGPKKAEIITRGSFLRTYKTVVAVQKKLGSDPEADRNEEVDMLSTLVEQIETQVEGEDLAGLSFLSFNEEQEEDAYGIEALRSLGCFAVPIFLQYQG
jgi:hypothetical protein